MVVKGATKKQRVQDFLHQRGQTGATGREIIVAVCADYGLYIAKLREAGAVIDRIPVGGNQHRYILRKGVELV